MHLPRRDHDLFQLELTIEYTQRLLLKKISKDPRASHTNLFILKSPFFCKNRNDLFEVQTETLYF